MVNAGHNYIGDVVNEDLKELVDAGRLTATSDFAEAAKCDCVCICVPTPLDAHQQPDISYVRSSTESIMPYVHKDMLVVLVTHDIILAARYCSRVIAVIHGRIGAAGSVEEVFTEDNMRDLFDIETEISEDARVGRNITIIGKYHGDDSNFEEEDPLDKSEGHEGKGND
jgi:uncharacterized protein YaiI (UPF0178 family)